MDDKEFLFATSADAREEETKNLVNNYKKLDSIINDLEKDIKPLEEELKDLRGDYKLYEEFKYVQKKIKDARTKVAPLRNIYESPYFSHIYLKEKSKDEDIYVGEKDVMDQKGNFFIVTWRSELGGLAYNDKREVKYHGYTFTEVFKRRIKIKNHNIADCVEEYNINNKGGTKITDYFLKQLLIEKKEVSGFTDIIKTIQEKQNEIIRSNINTNFICQGVAGSGKTAIIVHRLSYLIYNNKDVPENKYLFIAPNNNFKKELSELNKKLEIDKIPIKTLYEFYLEKLNYYLNMNTESEKYNITKIIDDDGEIKKIYSKEYAESKYLIIENLIDSKIKEISDYYDFKINKDYSIKEKASELDNYIRNKIDEFNRKRNKINKLAKEILSINKRLGQTSISSEYVKLSTKVEKYNSNVDALLKRYVHEIESNKNYINKLKKDEIFNVYIDNDFSRDSISKKTEELKLSYDDLNKEINKLEKSIFNVFQRDVITNKKEQLNSIKNNIDLYELALASFDENEEQMDIYITFDDDINDLIKKKEVIKESLKISDLCLEVSEIYKQLRRTNDISIDDVDTFDRSFKLIFNYILEKPQYVKPEVIDELVNTMNEMISENEDFDVDNYLKDKDNGNLLSNIFNPRNIINLCFTKVLNNKYSIVPESLNKDSLYRNDVFILLYIFNKLKISKQNNYSYLYIDEAQDYNDEEILLVRELEMNPIMNIFGDYQQNISKNSITRSDWNNLSGILGKEFKIKELTQNYRNTSNVVNYCNKVLKTKMESFGIEGKEVKEIDSMPIGDLIYLSKTKKAIIITNDIDLIEKIRTIDEKIKCNTVFEVKGLEYENIIVVDKGLDFNNKYVAYTRTKNDLYVVKNVTYEIGDYLDVEEKQDNTFNETIEENQLQENKSNNLIEEEQSKEVEVLKGKQEEKEKIDELSSEDIIEDTNDNNVSEEIITSMSDNRFNGFLNELSLLAKNDSIEYDDFVKFFETNRISSTWYVRFRQGLSKKGIQLLDSKYLYAMQLNDKCKYVIDKIGKSKKISDSDFIDLLLFVSNKDVERDKIYEYVVGQGVDIIED